MILCYTFLRFGFGVINIHANGNYLSGSSPMFNSTTQVAYITYASRGIVSLQCLLLSKKHGQSLSSNAKESVAFCDRIRHDTYPIRQRANAEWRVKRVRGYRLLGRVAARLSIPSTSFALRDSGISLALSEHLHSHVNFPSVSLHENCQRAQTTERVGGRNLGWNLSAQSRWTLPSRSNFRRESCP